MKGIIFHTLKGINGWSFLKLQKIDVCKILNIKYNKKLFCIFDYEYKYTLEIEIEYLEPNKNFYIKPVYGGCFVVLDDIRMYLTLLIWIVCLLGVLHLINL